MELRVEPNKEVKVKDFSVKRKDNFVEIVYNPFALQPKKDYKPEHRCFNIQEIGKNVYKFNYSIDNFIFNDLTLNENEEIISPTAFDIDEPVYEDFERNLKMDLIKESIEIFKGNKIDTKEVDLGIFLEEMDKKMRSTKSEKKRRLITKNGYTLVEIRSNPSSNKYWDIMAKNHDVTFVYKNQKMQCIIVDGKIK